MKKNLIIFVVAFVFGFLTHALVFPEFLGGGISDIAQIAIPNAFPTQAQSENINDPLTTKISFDGERFSRDNITIGFTHYLQIINNNQNTLMWLVSNDPALTTTRGYAYTETLQTQFNKRGQYVVENKNNSQERLVITVK